MLSKYQHPSSIFFRKYITNSEYPEFFTVKSNYYKEYDFKYVFKVIVKNKITNTDECISISKNQPRLVEGLGVFNPIDIVRNEVVSTFQPKITTFTRCGDSIRQYAVDVYEYFHGDYIQNSQTRFGKYLIMKNRYENFPFKEFLINENGVGKMLTENECGYKVRLTDYATMRFLNGSFSVNNSNTFTSKVYSVRFDFVSHDGTTLHCMLPNNNPWFYNNIYFNTSDNVLDSHDKIASRLLEIPTGPMNLKYITFIADGITPPNGNWFPIQLTQFYGETLLNNSSHYYVYLYTYAVPKDIRSKYYRYDIVCESTKKPYIQLQWENRCGGVDNFLFTKVYTKTNNINSTTILKNKNTQGGSDTWFINKNYFVGNNEYSRGLTSIYSDEVTTYTLNTDWVNQKECDYLESLWSSNNIFAYIDGLFYPVISLSEKQIIKTTASGLRQYNFEIQLSNAKYNTN